MNSFESVRTPENSGYYLHANNVKILLCDGSLFIGGKRIDLDKRAQDTLYLYAHYQNSGHLLEALRDAGAHLGLQHKTDESLRQQAAQATDIIGFQSWKIRAGDPVLIQEKIPLFFLVAGNKDLKIGTKTGSLLVRMQTFRMDDQESAILRAIASHDGKIEMRYLMDEKLLCSLLRSDIVKLIHSINQKCHGNKEYAQTTSSDLIDISNQGLAAFPAILKKPSVVSKKHTKAVVSSSCVELGHDISFDTENLDVFYKEQKVAVTFLQKELLSSLAENEGRLTPDKIVEIVGGDLSISYMKTHYDSLYKEVAPLNKRIRLGIKNLTGTEVAFDLVVREEDGSIVIPSFKAKERPSQPAPTAHASPLGQTGLALD
jgi:hypothetical protein